MENIKLLESRITSVELVELINEFRQAEQGENFTELRHKNLMAKIEKEQKTLKTLGLSNGLNFQPIEYMDKKGEKRPCYSVDKNGMLMLLNKE